MKAQPLIPDAALRDAYLVVARRNGCGRDRIVAETALLDEVRTRLGPDYAHVPPDWIRQRVITCCKNPKAHGGDWGNPKKPAPRKLKQAAGYSPEYLAHLDSPAWQEIRQAAFDRDGGRCRLCNSRQNLQGHHRSYANLGRDAAKELADVTTLCRKCHKRFHKI